MSAVLTWWSRECIWTEKVKQELHLVLLVDHSCHKQVVTDLNQWSGDSSDLVLMCTLQTSTTALPVTMVLT